MPTYDYRCKSCGHEFEAHQKFTDDPLTDCPSCGEPQLRKVFSAVGISFKGSGFYKTDSRSGSGSKTSATASSGDSAKDGGSKDGGSKESSTSNDSGGSKGTSTSKDSGSKDSGSKESGSKSSTPSGSTAA